MAVEAIQQVTELERTVKQEKEAAAAESKQRILEAQRSARRQVEESRQNAEAETRQMMAEAEQEAAKWTRLSWSRHGWTVRKRSRRLGAGWSRRSLFW